MNGDDRADSRKRPRVATTQQGRGHNNVGNSNRNDRDNDSGGGYDDDDDGDGEVPRSSSPRLLRLNVGGYPYDVIRNTLPLLETMMNDRWLSSCLYDADGRIFLERDGEAFGDILRYFRGGLDFLLGLVRAQNGRYRSGSYGGSHQSSNPYASSSVSSSSSPAVCASSVDRLRRLRVEADYYGLNDLVRDVDVVTVGQRAVFAADSWARISGECCVPRNGNGIAAAAAVQQHQQRQPNELPNRQNDARDNRIPAGRDAPLAAALREDRHRDDARGGREGGEEGRADENDPEAEEEDPAVEDNRNGDDDGEEENADDDDVDDDDAQRGEEEEEEEDEAEAEAEVEGGGEDDDEEVAAPEEEGEDMEDEAAAAEEDEDEEEDAAGDEQDDDDDEEEEGAEEEDEGEEDGDGDEPDDDPDDDELFPPAYKNWQWSCQHGNPEILRPHPSQNSMIVGQTGTYLLLLRLSAALPSPLARIKWDQMEEDDRIRTRAGSAVGIGRSRGGSYGGPKEVEEDYFITVNIEAPLSTVMDSIDESQTHFPLLRAGLWDYRTEEEVLHEDPVYATVCAVDAVSLRAGDVLSVSFINDDVSREKHPFPNDIPAGLVNSLTLVRVHGDTLARYERLKTVPPPTVMDAAGGHHNHYRHSAASPGSDRSRRAYAASAARRVKFNPTRFRNGTGDEIGNSLDAVGADGRLCSSPLAASLATDGASSPSFSRDPETEEIDRSLVRTARWIKPRNDFLPTPFEPRVRSASTVVEFPNPGQYLLLGRVAVGCRRDARFDSVFEGGPTEGHRVQLSLRSAGGRLLHAVGAFAFENRPRLGCSDLSILSENGMFNDVVHVPRAGTELSISTTGDCRLHPEGTEVGPFCSAVSQSLSLLLLDDDAMEVDRYMIGTVRTRSQAVDDAEEHREIKWFYTPSSRIGRGAGGTQSDPSLFDVDGHRLVWRGCLDYRGCSGYDHNQQNSERPPAAGSASTVLVLGSLPPLQRGYSLALLKNNEPVAISITPESLDAKGRHAHYFQEVLELSDGDELSVGTCAFGSEERGWAAQLHVEPRMVEFDTRIGHLSFIVLQNSSEEGYHA